MQVGQTVTYTPTTTEQPMAFGKPQAALVTDWDAETSKADLIVFPKDANYGMFKDGVLEGTDPGSFQQLGTGAASTPPPATAAASTHTTTSKK